MPSKSSIIVDEAIVRERAYLMWEADGRPDGLSDHYWSLASAQTAKPVKAKRVTASAKAPVPEKKAKPAKAAKPAKPVKAAKPAKKKSKA